MAVYNVNGVQMPRVYNVNNNLLSYAYDVNGNEVLHGTAPIQPMDWSNIPTQYRTNIADAVSYTTNYISNHEESFAFPVLTDVHDKFYNEPNYLLYNYHNVFDKFLFLGDIANTYSQTQMNNAKAYMEQASSVNVLALVGNHELAGWAEGNDLPKVWYQPLLPSSAVVMSDTDALVYYFDDTNNARFIVLDSCTPIYQSSGSQLLTKNELEFFASALDSAGNKTIILLNHSPGQGYTWIADPTQTGSSTTVDNLSVTMRAIVNAYINRSSCTVTDDNDVSHTHDYSTASGYFVGFITGHEHRGGYNSGQGYNMFTLPSSYYNDSAMSIFIIDKTLRKVIWLIAYKNESSYGIHEYTY